MPKLTNENFALWNVNLKCALRAKGYQEVLATWNRPSETTTSLTPEEGETRPSKRVLEQWFEDTSGMVEEGEATDPTVKDNGNASDEPKEDETPNKNIVSSPAQDMDTLQVFMGRTQINPPHETPDANDNEVDSRDGKAKAIIATKAGLKLTKSNANQYEDATSIKLPTKKGAINTASLYVPPTRQKSNRRQNTNFKNA